jgi:predicted small secreted protein
MKKIFALICIGFTLSACNTVQGIGRDVQKAGSVVEGAARN